MKKPSVYLDTNIISAYWYSGSVVAALARRASTRDWWQSEREHFEVWASGFTYAELRAGRFPRQADCLKMARRVPYLPMTQAASLLLGKLLESGIVPSTKRGDAVQMAVAAAHHIDYLLTWNYAHMANPIAQARLAEICARMGLQAPLLVSPESIPQVRLGQSIRRRRS
jgi:predicted nucleic acid-binding protein